MTKSPLSNRAFPARPRSCGTRVACLIALAVALVGGTARAATEVSPGCGSLQNAYGPFDYRTDKHKLGIVEKYHFSPETEYLRKSVGVASNLDYTLRAFPNHHRALMSMMNLGAREKKAKLPRTEYTVECYFIRAEAFRPDDAAVKVLFGLYLFKNGRQKEGVQKMEAAKSLGSSDANIPYNVGLAYFELGQYDKALENAHEAYRLGFQLPGLKNKLEKAGKWQDAAPGFAVEAGNRSAAPEAPTKLPAQ